MAIPLIELLYAFLDLNLVGPSQRVELAHVDELARCAVGFVGVKDNRSLEAHGLDNQL